MTFVYIAILYLSTVQRLLYKSMPVWLYCLLISLDVFCVKCFILITEYGCPSFDTTMYAFVIHT